MNDPHVASLTYAASPSDTASFENAPPIEGTTDGINYRLNHGQLRIEPNIHFPSIERAREHVDPLLASWEIDIALRFGSPELSFLYQTAEVIDRDPPPPGSPHVIQVQSVASASASGTATLRVSRGHYPDPPTSFRTSPDVDTLWERYQGYRQGREPLPSMAYFCLTLLEAMAGSRSRAAKTFRISARVLTKIGQLTSERGDPSTARKYRAVISGSPLTGLEIHWLEEAIKAIIRRVGELSSTEALSTIELNDLPPL